MREFTVIAKIVVAKIIEKSIVTEEGCMIWLLPFKEGGRFVRNPSNSAYSQKASKRFANQTEQVVLENVLLLR